MKAQFLKIAGVTTEKEFYDKFPTEESFMAKHGGKFKKAQNGMMFKQPFIPETRYNFSSVLPDPGLASEDIFNPSNIPGFTNFAPDDNYLIDQNRQIIGESLEPMEPVNNNKFDVMGKGIPFAGNLMAGISALEGEKQKRKQAEQAKKVSDITLQASATRPEQIERRYVRPEDNVFSTNQFFPANGVGTNVLAKEGKTIYQDGGGVFSEFGQNPYGMMAGSFFDNNAGSQIGGTLGSAFGPVGGVVGSVIGGALDTNGRRTKKAQEATHRNLTNMMLNNAAPGIQAGYASHLESGGDVSPLLEGELNTHWGGEAEIMSYNPYLPNNGETLMFRGASHDNGGIGITYGNTPVEVEGGEPAVELKDGGNATNLTVFGNLKIPNEYIPILGDKDAKGKKFKNYIADLSKKETKQNKITEKASSLIDSLEVLTPYDKLKFSALQATITGANMKLKDIAEKKTNAAMLQSAINDVAEEQGLNADALSKGKVRKAQTGITTSTDPNRYGLQPWPGNKTGLGEATASSFTLDQWNQIADKLNFKGKGNKEFQEFLLSNEESAPLIKERHSLLYKKDPFIDEKLGYGWSAAGLLNQRAKKERLPEAPETTITENNYEIVPYKRNKVADLFNMVLPFIRPTDQEGLDYNQLMGEMYALSNNQVDPVQAQTYQPDLNTPYDISYQDQLNANQSDYRSIQRLSGYNPAAQAIINAQKYSANEKVLGEQFRANQAMKDKVFAENRNTLNDAKLKNLGIDINKQLLMNNLASNYKKYVLKTSDVMKTKSYDLLVFDGLTAGKVIQELENEDISNIQLLKTKHSQEEKILADLAGHDPP